MNSDGEGNVPGRGVGDVPDLNGVAAPTTRPSGCAGPAGKKRCYRGASPPSWDGAFFETIGRHAYAPGTIVEVIGIGAPDTDDCEDVAELGRTLLRGRAADDDGWWYFTSAHVRPLTPEACAFYAELLDGERRAGEAVLP
jgi:hypothetical protein